MTSDNVTEAESVELSEAAPTKSVNNQLIDELVGRAQAEGPSAGWRGRAAPAVDQAAPGVRSRG